jgi:prolyl-tRNA editing enzyme YbaK/EbsC (Cys-tRNA(Pro) deacylase)
MQYHKTVSIIRELLDKEQLKYKFFEHEAVRTSEEANKLRPDYKLKQGAKAMIVRIKKDREKSYAMLVLPGDKRFDNRKAKQALGVKDITFASEEEVTEITRGIKLGGVPPFGNLFKLKVIVDPSLFENEEIIFNCGDKQASIAMKSEDYKKIVKPIVEIIT